MHKYHPGFPYQLKLDWKKWEQREKSPKIVDLEIRVPGSGVVASRRRLPWPYVIPFRNLAKGCSNTCSFKKVSKFRGKHTNQKNLHCKWKLNTLCTSIKDLCFIYMSFMSFLSLWLIWKFIIIGVVYKWFLIRVYAVVLLLRVMNITVGVVFILISAVIWCSHSRLCSTVSLYPSCWKQLHLKVRALFLSNINWWYLHIYIYT